MTSSHVDIRWSAMSENLGQWRRNCVVQDLGLVAAWYTYFTLKVQTRVCSRATEVVVKYKKLISNEITTTTTLSWMKSVYTTRIESVM